MASPKKADGEIPKTTLKGHQGSVLCLDLSSPASNQEATGNDGVNSAGASPSNTTTLLISGSEDHTARIWDLREHRRRACLCIQTPGDVLSAVFAPNCTIKGEHEPAASSPFALDHTIYLAVGNTVLEYDLRHTKTPIVRQPTRNFGPVLQHQDEVNQISLAYGCIPKATIKKHSKKSDSKKGNKLNDTVPASNNLYLAACDDAGTVRFMDTDNTNTSTILHHDSKGVAVVPTCAFRTKLTTKNDKATSVLELVSGGSDCKIHLWDLSRPKKPISSYTVDHQSRINNDGSTAKPQVCNPPLFHSLAWSCSGQTLAAGLGNGSIGIFAIENRNLVETGRITDGAHDSAVVSLTFPNFSVDSAERILCSAGSDGSIFFWDLGSVICLGWGDTEWGAAEGGGKGNNSNKSSTDDANITDLFAKSVSLDNQGNGKAIGKRTKLFGIPHGQKMNWVTQAATSGSSKKDVIFVADTSPDITCYTIPMR